jgi:hypothetical protein
MGPLALFGIENDGVNFAVNLAVLLLVTLWLALIFWTFADARRRIEDPLLVGCATAASVFPFIGTVVYMIVRPPEYLEDARERELEIAASEARLIQIEGEHCPHCHFSIEKDFLRCPSCLRRLKEPCHNCAKPLDPKWKLCPYCEAEIGASAAPTRSRGRAGPGRGRPGAAQRSPAGRGDGGAGPRPRAEQGAGGEPAGASNLGPRGRRSGEAARTGSRPDEGGRLGEDSRGLEDGDGEPGAPEPTRGGARAVGRSGPRPSNGDTRDPAGEGEGAPASSRPPR